MKFMSKKNPPLYLYGFHAVTSALHNPARTIIEIWTTKDNQDEIKPIISNKIPLKIVDKQSIDRLFQTHTPHQNIIAKCKPLDGEDLTALPPKGASSVVVLDQVTDPHNVGAIIRSAVAFGADAIILPKDRSATENGAMAKAASGGLDIIPLIYVTNIARTLEQLKELDYFCVGLSGHTKTYLHDTNLQGRIAFVFGAEGKGMRRLVQETCDLMAKIPISPKMESLNVANCASITLYEYTTQNRK